MRRQLNGPARLLQTKKEAQLTNMSQFNEPTETCIFEALGVIVEAEIPTRLLARLAESGQVLIDPDIRTLIIEFGCGEIYTFQTEPVTLH
jgi:hypothetical protein